MEFNLSNFIHQILAFFDKVIIKLITTNPMILLPQTPTLSRTNSIVRSFNPEESLLSASRLNSPSLKLGKIQSWKFIYKSPTRIKQLKNEGPLAFNKQAHKVVIRKLPKFHEHIQENDPLKNSKIVENINFFREQLKRNQEMNQSQGKTLERTRLQNGQFEVSRVLVHPEFLRNPQHLNFSRSLSCSHMRLGNSRLSVIEGLKNRENLCQSIIRQEGNLLESRVSEARKGKRRVNMAESQYFGGIIMK